MTFGAAMSKPVWASGEESHRSSRDSVADDYSEAGVAEPQALGLAEVTTKHGEEIQARRYTIIEKFTFFTIFFVLHEQVS